MSGAAADDGFSQFSVDNAAALKNNMAVDKVKARRAVNAEASGKRKPAAPAVAIAPAPQPTGPEPIAKRPVSKETAKRLLSDTDKEAAADESDRKHAIKIYRGYWQSPHTRPFCGGKEPNENWSLPQAAAALSGARSTCEAQNALDLTGHAVEWGLRGLTYVTQDMGINPRGWQLRDRNGVSVADVFKAQKDSPAFQPALSEVGAEAGLVATQSCYTRLGFALWDLCEGFSRAQQSPAGGAQIPSAGSN